MPERLHLNITHLDQAIHTATRNAGEFLDRHPVTKDTLELTGLTLAASAILMLSIRVAVPALISWVDMLTVATGGK
ncbi:hypothetical protein HYU94_03795 [Candidatus Daviesbacteria bacterium]|nr:hypothetical protein [Candidatus Daviesbacteria bacterium]